MIDEEKNDKNINLTNGKLMRAVSGSVA